MIHYTHRLISLVVAVVWGNTLKKGQQMTIALSLAHVCWVANNNSYYPLLTMLHVLVFIVYSIT